MERWKFKCDKDKGNRVLFGKEKEKKEKLQRKEEVKTLH